MGPLIYLSDFEKYPISLGLHMYNALEGSWVNLLMAASIVALGPLVVIFFFAQRYFVKGILLTGTKG
jgi:multiple sugar transport system permease protein